MRSVSLRAQYDLHWTDSETEQGSPVNWEYIYLLQAKLFHSLVIMLSTISTVNRGVLYVVKKIKNNN